MHPDGSATVKAGTSAHGQGHATAYSQLVTGELGIPIERITFVQSDTALVPRGGGTGGSRSLQVGGSAVLEASRGVLDRARSLAAELLEAAPEDIVLTDDGTLGVAGRPGQGDHLGRDRDQGQRRRLPARGRARLRAVGRVVPVRRARVGGRGRHGDRPGRADPPHRGRRLRSHPQPDAGRRPGARRVGVRHLAGAVGGDGLRRRRQPAHVDAGRVRHPERGRVPAVRGRAHARPRRR